MATTDTTPNNDDTTTPAAGPDIKAQEKLAHQIFSDEMNQAAKKLAKVTDRLAKIEDANKQPGEYAALLGVLVIYSEVQQKLTELSTTMITGD